MLVKISSPAGTDVKWTLGGGKITEFLPCMNTMIKEMPLQKPMAWSCAQLNAPHSHWCGLADNIRNPQMEYDVYHFMDSEILSEYLVYLVHSRADSLFLFFFFFLPHDDFHWLWNPVPGCVSGLLWSLTLAYSGAPGKSLKTLSTSFTIFFFRYKGKISNHKVAGTFLKCILFNLLCIFYTMMTSKFIS